MEELKAHRWQTVKSQLRYNASCATSFFFSSIRVQSAYAGL